MESLLPDSWASFFWGGVGQRGWGSCGQLCWLDVPLRHSAASSRAYYEADPDQAVRLSSSGVAKPDDSTHSVRDGVVIRT